ncbi:MAG: thiamine pyrophosphate-binding protein [Thermodesulfobacteriota bacterium]
MTGGEMIARMLQLHDVQVMMGMGGFQLLPMYDAFRRFNLRHYLVNDEKTAVCAMDAYARVTNKPGVCDASLGPGATNLVTGLVESFNAGIPLISLVGDTNRDHSWKNMTQECRQSEILKPAVKELIRIERLERIPEMVRRAFSVAASGKPGPVVLDVPEDVCHGEGEITEAHFQANRLVKRVPSQRCRPEAREVERAADWLAKARRPLLLVGGGIHISEAYSPLLELAENNGIPVGHTISGKGAIPCSHPLSAGVFGRYSRIANDLIQSSDLLIVVGCKLGEIATKRFQLIQPGVPMVHLDIIPEEFGRTTPADICLLGDARLGLEDLAAAVGDKAEKARAARREYVAEIPERMKIWRQGAESKLRSAERPINIARLYEELNAVMPERSVLVADGGFAAHWGGLLYDTKSAGRMFVANRGFASIGYGLPGTIGAKLGAPDRAVVGVTGDAGFNMMIGDLETARRIGLPLVIIVVNNSASGYVKALQHLLYGSEGYQSSDLSETNFAGVARAMGCEGVRVEDPGDLRRVFEEVISGSAGPVVVDVVVTRDPAQMLPGVDNRIARIEKGDRIA